MKVFNLRVFVYPVLPYLFCDFVTMQGYRCEKFYGHRSPHYIDDRAAFKKGKAA